MSNLRTTGARCVVGYVSAMCKEVIEDGEKWKIYFQKPLGRELASNQLPRVAT